MGSSDSEVPVSTSRPDLPIPELIKSIKHSFRECEFDEVRNILMDREKSMKYEIENLERDRALIREEVRLLERTQGLAELEKLKFEEKLQMSKRECEELRETVKRLIEDQRLSRDREKMAQDRYAKVCEEHSKMASEKNKAILELNVKINKLKNQNKEAADLKVVELRRENLEAVQTVEELKRQNLEAEKAAQLHKNRFENLAPRITKAEEAIASMLKLKVDDIANLVKDEEKSAAAEEDENVSFPYCEGGKESLGNITAQGGRNADFGKMGVKLSGVSSTSNSAGNGYSGLSKKGTMVKRSAEKLAAKIREKEEAKKRKLTTSSQPKAMEASSLRPAPRSSKRGQVEAPQPSFPQCQHNASLEASPPIAALQDASRPPGPSVEAELQTPIAPAVTDPMSVFNTKPGTLSLKMGMNVSLPYDQDMLKKWWGPEHEALLHHNTLQWTCFGQVSD